MHVCKTLCQVGQIRRRRSTGLANGHVDEQMDEQMGEGTDCACDLFIFKCALFTIANERENTLEHLSLEIMTELRRTVDLFVMPYAYVVLE